MPPELTEALARINELTDEELAELAAALEAHYAEVRNVEDPSDDDITAMSDTRTAQAAVAAEVGSRETAAEERRARAAAIDAEGEEGEAEDAATEPEAETSADGGDDDDGEAAPVADEPAAPAGVAAEAEEVAVEEVPEPVAATAPAPARPALGRVAARVPASRQPARARRSPSLGRTTITAAADVPGYSAGSQLDSVEDLVAALDARADSLRHVRGGDGVRYPVARIHYEYPEERQLTSPNAEANTEKLNALLSPQALTASGGLCAPLTPFYDVAQISGDQRPVRDSLPSFQATRGGVRWVPPPRLGDYNSGVAIWDVANDTTPSSPATKPCVRVDCDAEETATVEAITRCLEIGNFYDRTFGERRNAILELLRATHARVAENELLTAIGAGSTAVTTGQQLGAARDLLAKLDLLVAGFRSRHRLMGGVSLRFMAPEWVHGLLRADLRRQMPGDQTMDVSDGQIDTMIRNSGVVPSFFIDGEAGQVFGNQGAAPIDPWPSTVVTYLFHEGAWTFLDGGTLDLGIVRDSTLNATNDLQVFAETFEGVFYRGIESLRPAFDVCPDGTSSGTNDIAICDTGS